MMPELLVPCKVERALGSTKAPSGHHRHPSLWSIIPQLSSVEFTTFRCGREGGTFSAFSSFAQHVSSSLAAMRTLCHHPRLYFLGKWGLASSLARDGMYAVVVCFGALTFSWPYAALSSGTCHLNHSKNVASIAVTMWDVTGHSDPAKAQWDFPNWVSGHCGWTAAQPLMYEGSQRPQELQTCPFWTSAVSVLH